jgi:hypothetical protein
VIALPPFEPGVKETEADPSPPIAVPIVGAAGAVGAAGVAVAVELGVLVPTALIALTRKLYDNAFVKPVTVVEVEVEVPSEKVVQVVGSLANLYSTK